ncbi:MAG: Holliday junction branch migration protein RuvA [Bacteroidetes bacterium]|nr:Holliday junction branch migration protein RuvA [Bacteroidota bacterium]
MIAYIEGKLTYKCPTYVIMEAGGIGYQVNISLYTYNKVSNLESGKLYTHLHIKEDAHTLYGFYDETEKEIFILLISISGIGPSVARTILSSLSSHELQQAVVEENYVLLESIKGIGAKSAKRIVLELKDKLLKLEVEPNIIGSEHNTNKREALSALVMLGFNKTQAEQSINKILKSSENNITVEELIKLALKNM